MRAADILAKRLYEAGCRFAFGVPGGETLTLMDALEAAGVRFVLAAHETAAGLMAEGAWARTGSLPVLVATIGPGLANAINAIVNARLDRVPLVVLSGCLDANEDLAYTHQIIDHARLVESAVKASFRLDPDAADLVARKAINLALSPRPGPVHVDVPVKAAAAGASFSPHPPRAARTPSVPAANALQTARAWLEEARRPLLLVGFDAVQDGAGAAVRRFAERFKTPVLQTYKAKGLLPEDHPLAVAAFALSPSADKAIKPLIEAADLVVLAGVDAIEVRPSWTHPWDPLMKRVVEVCPLDDDQDVWAASLRLIGDTGRSLDTLGEGVQPAAAWGPGEAARARAAVLEPFRIDEAWGPAAVGRVVRARLPRATPVAFDSGAHRILLSQVFPAAGPRTVLQSNGHCTMGAAIPLALGAALAEGGPALAFVGDGGLLMAPGDLATAAALNLTLPVVVFLDHSLALIEKKQRETNLARVGVRLPALDLAALARGLGGVGVEVEDAAALDEALEAALARQTFTLIGCRIDASDYDGRL